MSAKKHIVIYVQGGVVQDVTGIPKNVTVEVRDYDCDGMPDECKTDEDGDSYILTEYEGGQ